MAAGKIAEAQFADADADQAFHFESELVKHPANLAVDALAQNNAEPIGFQRVHFLNPGALAVEHDAVEQFRRERSVPATIERHLVFFFDLVTRMSQALGEVAIVREEKKPFRLRVKPAYIEQARQVRREQVENGVAGVWIAARGNEASGLVQHQIEPALLCAEEFAVDFDVVAFRRLRAEVGANLPVDRDPPGRNQFIAMPARPEPGRGEVPVQAHWEVTSAK